jgi:hypothetical protein
MERTEVTFKDGHVLVKSLGDAEKSTDTLSWSNNLAVDGDALVWRPTAPTAPPVGWVQSKPMAVSINWRPPQRAQVKLALRGSTEQGVFRPRVFVRYGCDRVHWSRWQPVRLTQPEAAKADARDGQFRLRGELEVVAPDKTRERYTNLMGVWRKTEPDWDCDEEEFCRWLAKRHPKFLDRQFPFVGYLQFLIEDPRWEHVRLQAVDMETSWGVGGLASVPKSGKEPVQGPWRFVGQSNTLFERKPSQRLPSTATKGN